MTTTGAAEGQHPERPAAELIEAVDLGAASRALAGAVTRTPTIDCPELGELTGSPVSLKAECLQSTGSFKIRGAYNFLSLMSEADRKKGVVGWSSGNHAQGLAEAGRLLSLIHI